MARTTATLGILSALLWSSTALAARDQRVLKAIDLFDRAEFTQAKDLLATLVDAPALADEDLLQARIYLAASYYGLGDRASARAQFLVLVRRFPRVELDQGLFLPEVVDLFRQARMEVVKEAPPDSSGPGASRSAPRGAGAPGPGASGPGAAPGGAQGGLTAMTFLPFGVGQFTRGDALAGHLFLWGEVGTLALAAAAKIHFQYLKLEPSRPWDFSQPAYVANPRYANTVQSVFVGSLIASGVIAVSGIAEAALRAGPGPMKLMVGPGAGGIEVRF